MPDVRRAYPSDLSDAEWALLEPLLPPAKPNGRPRRWSDQLIADAVFYVLRSGCAWRMLPDSFRGARTRSPSGNAGQRIVIPDAQGITAPRRYGAALSSTITVAVCRPTSGTTVTSLAT